MMLHTQNLAIQRFTWNVIDSNAYLITEGKNGLLIDTVDDTDLFDQVKSFNELTIILTHSHFDHISGLNQIRQLKPNVKVIASSQCSRNIGNKHRNMSASGNAFLAFYLKRNNRSSELVESTDKLRVIKSTVCDPADVEVEDDLSLMWEGHEIELSRFFGHSNDSMIAIIDGKYMFSGDTILSIPTVTRFPGGSTKRFWHEDMPKLREKGLQIDTVFPGHGDPGKLVDFIASNIEPEGYIHEP